MEWTSTSKAVAGWSVGHGADMDSEHRVLVQVLGGNVLISADDAEAMATALLMQARRVREFDSANRADASYAA